jgi:hypothetical protein
MESDSTSRNRQADSSCLAALARRNDKEWSMGLPSFARLDSRGRLSLHVPW